MAETNKLPRELYKKIKKMDNESLSDFLQDFYMDGKNDAYKEFQELIITEDLKERIGCIKGIGAARLDEIMNVIEAYLTSVLSEENASENE